jgi:GT2 family glycosyltransferase
VLSYNSLATLRDVVDAVLGGNVVPGRLIVVDNASTDGTGAWLASGPDGVEALVMPENVGVGAGHTAGWHRAIADPDCQWVWSLEHDAVPAPEALERLLESATSHPDPEHLALVRPRTYLDREQLTARVGAYPAAASPDELIETSMTTFNGPLIPRRVIERHGELRRDFFLCLEDRDFARRVSAAGLTMVVDPSAIVWHDWGDRRPLGASVARSYYSARNAVYWRRHIDHEPNAVLRATAWTFASCVRTIVLDDHKVGRTHARWRALVDGLRGDLGRKDYGFLTADTAAPARPSVSEAVGRAG